WIGTKEEGGLSRFDRKSNSFKNYKRNYKANGLTDDYIFSISELDSVRLLIGTFNKGMAIFNKSRESFEYFINDPTDSLSIEDNRVYVIFKDIDERIWVGHQSFLQEFIPSTKKFKTIAQIRTPKCIINQNSNSLWVGTRTRGLFLYNKESGSIKEYKYDPENTNSISSNDIFSIRKDNQENLWIGTKHGLCKLNISNDSITRYFEQDGLASNWICALEIDNENNLWASTINGLSKFDLKINKFRNYDVKDGLQGNEFEGYVSLTTKDGQILFGGRNGFNIFSPSSITNNRTVPNIVLTGFKLFNKEVIIGEPNSPLEKHISKIDKLKLKHDQSAFTIEYTALNYTSPEKNQYKYILEGFDKDWISAGNMRSAIYTNIPPGNYTFRVIGSNNDDYWNEQGSSLHIEVLPPPWKTDLAYFFYVLILLLLFFSIRKMLIIRIEQKQLIEFERKDKNRIQELNNLKLRFFTNIAHEFRTPLTLISGPIEKLLSFKNDNDEQRYLLTLMHNNVKRLLQLINELMDFRKAENEKLKLHVSQNDPVKLVEDIIQCFEDSVIEKCASLHFNHQLPENAAYWFDFSIIEKIVFNLLSNALKHTPQGGRVGIDISVKNNFMEISVSDSGKGISKENMEGIFERFFQVDEGTASNLAGSGIGLAFSKRLIEVHHGTIAVDSLLNIGSKFTIQFPVSMNSYNQSEIVISSDNKRSYLADLPYQYSSKIEDEKTDKSEKIKHEKILIIEDNDEMRNFLLNNLGVYSLYAAENGKIGYDLALKEIPDIIISDVVMPEMSGLEICEKLKTQMATSHIPIILLSSKTEVAHKIEGIETGADAYIEKPFDLNYLQAVIKNLLKQREKLRTRFTEEPEINPSVLGLTSHEKKFIEKVFKIIGENIENPDFSVEILGTEIGLSRSQLFRKFKILYDLKPSELIRTERLKKSKSLLSTREFNINEVAYQTGFKSASYFITSFKKYYGITPNEFIHQARK
ncbi:MAG: response regulator, partial [Bacteroidales bacterium]|nr:response regulator [Bacteroidales bacterium]